MNADFFNDYSARAVMGLVLINLVIFVWLGRAWLIKTTAKSSRLFMLSLLAVCVLACLLVFLHPEFAQ